MSPRSKDEQHLDKKPVAKELGMDGRDDGKYPLHRSAEEMGTRGGSAQKVPDGGIEGSFEKRDQPDDEDLVDSDA